MFRISHASSTRGGQHRCRTDSCSVVQFSIDLMLFNLLIPTYPFAGGKILVDLLLLANVPAKVTAWITIVTAVAVSVAVIVKGYYGLVGILIALFILYSTFGLWQYLNKGQIRATPSFPQGIRPVQKPRCRFVAKE